jgi:hypothetical protein
MNNFYFSKFSCDTSLKYNPTFERACNAYKADNVVCIVLDIKRAGCDNNIVSRRAGVYKTPRYGGEFAGRTCDTMDDPSRSYNVNEYYKFFEKCLSTRVSDLNAYITSDD